MSTSATPPTPTAPVVVGSTTLDKVLDSAIVGVAVAGEFGAALGGPAVPAVAAILAKLLTLAKTTLDAHEAISGEPMDQLLAQLQTHIEPV